MISIFDLAHKIKRYNRKSFATIGRGKKKSTKKVTMSKFFEKESFN
jgi:hypothetical protein